MALYVQYGCGLSGPDGWVNYDASPRLRIERLPLLGTLALMSGKALFPKSARYGDIVAGLPHHPGSVRGIYCSHVLEHLDRASVVKALANTYELLEPGGTFRLVVPDLIWRARQLIVESEAKLPAAADHFMRQSYLGCEQPMTTIIDRFRAIYGNSMHRWMFDCGLMTALLEETGFVAIRRCEFGDANDPMFHLVEERSRFRDNENDELAMEARRAD